MKAQPPTNAPKLTTPTGGRPRTASNKSLTAGIPNPMLYTAGFPLGEMLKRGYEMVAAVVKQAGEENEPGKATHESAPKQQYRPRAEVIAFNSSGVLAIDKGDYILFPGGGIPDGEQPRDAVLRETLEESGHALLNLVQDRVVESTWPTGTNGFWDNSEFDGERTYFFLAVDSDDSGLKHEDREDFGTIPFDALKTRLRELIADEKQAWAKANNETRLDLVEAAERMVKADGLKPVKYASLTEPQLDPNTGMPIPTKTQQFIQQRKQQTAAPMAPTGPTAPPPGPTPAAVPAPAPAVTAAPAPKVASNVLTGGESDGVPDSAFNPKDLAVGVVEESEHTDREPVAKEIAKDHLSEDRAYYRKLEDAGLLHQGSTEKTADIAQFLRRTDTIRFTPDGRLIVRRLPNRRFGFMGEGGKRAPYEDPVRFIPEGGIPDPGYHGFDIQLNLDEGQDVPEGYEAIDPDVALKDMYASMGLATNKPYRMLDRARARVILRELRKRRKSQPPVSVPTPPESLQPSYQPAY